MRLIVAAAMLAAAGTAGTVQAQTKLKFSTFGSADAPIQKCAYAPVLETIKQRSGGKIEIEAYWGGRFGEPTKQYDQLARGIMDISVSILAYKPGSFPLTDMIGMPMVYSDGVKATRALMKVLPQHLSQEFEEVHIMWLALTSPYQFHLREPIKSIADLKGKRVRVSGRIHIEALAALGIDGVAMPVTQQYENLQKGVIAASLGTWTTVSAFKLSEVTKHHYEADFGGSVVFFGIAKKVYQGLAPELKAAIDAGSGVEVAARGADCFNIGDRAGQAQARAAGNGVTRISDADRAVVEKAIQPVIEKHLADLEDKKLPARKVFQAMKDAIAAEK